jgi:hypothetical protein
MAGFDCMQGKIPDKPRSTCPKCGVPNKCGIDAGKGSCWCFMYPPIEHMNMKDTDTCLCESCLKEEMNKA